MDLKATKKAARKLKHCEKILLKHENVKLSLIPSNSLFIGNGGLGCGIQREFLTDLFSCYGALEDIVLLPDKPYAFVVYKKTEDSEKAFASLHGQKQKSGHMFYISYINRSDVPQYNATYSCWPKGLVLMEDFITPEEEFKMLSVFSFEDCNDKAVLKHRKVKHYGYEFIYGSNNIDKNKCLDSKIPTICMPHLEKLVALGYIPRVPDQLTVNHYLPGQGIPPHVDTHSAFEDGIISLSLGSQVVMDFSSPEHEVVPVFLPRRSVLIMLGESRYKWKHG
ncbi:alkylated DNA repair protein alkB homolog 8-like [Stegodyphus dumicola]|uniref:alkylated DNA repair protein alkB homolog 8-like n=1 Tax=Stegodyphus dumicola TaxID=202533 RepID=UPI0015A799D2|nr:alkylated DNA repair protein alkB homolog 8-like [Stegodyphus dumicola]